MLAPKDRTLLLESLRAPPGYRLDAAVSTTYSLDLMALLVAPLAFTFFDWEGDDGQPTKDPNALLEALRRHVDRIHVFCQAGQIAVPKTYRLLFGYLESSVHEVRAVREGGVFHPKVWIVRYMADGEPAQYRLLCASRNLTFDRSWDTLLVLDGVVGKEATKKNEPLSRFIRTLQEMAVQELTDNTKNTLAELARELDYVEFQLPDHIENIEFWPIGLPREQDVWPFPDSADRGLVIAPFVAESTLSRLNISGEQTLVSRVDELEAIDPDQIGDYEIFALSEGADMEQEEGAEPDEGSDTGSLLSGLHAKLFAFDDSGIGRVWTGSANATNAAFHQNVEFLVEMQGQSKHMGVEAILCPQQKGISVLRDLLEPFSPGEEGGADSAQQVLENLLLRLRRFVVDLELVVHAEKSEENLFDLRLSSTKAPDLPDTEFDLQCWPLTLRQEAGAQCLISDGGWSSSFSSVSFEGLTTFFAFEGRISVDGRSGVCRFVLNLPSQGFPENRRQRLLRYMLKDQQQLMRYLFLLLGEEGALSLSEISGSSRYAGTGNGGFHADIPMLEALVKALERAPEKIDQVAHLVTDLQNTEEGRALLPQEFEQIWHPLWEAREELTRRGS
ncbi:MAG: hypothetical protein AB2689_15825 [Candidatus Thiodiazotropha taylori]